MFSGLQIDTAGSYVIKFTTSAAVEPNFVLSNEFVVGIGRAARVVVDQEPGGARGGVPLTLQPQVKLIDLGGNVLVEDRNQAPFSTVTVSVENNPNSATISVGGKGFVGTVVRAAAGASAVLRIDVVDGGVGYFDASVTVTDSGGSGFEGVVNLDADGAVTGITVVAGGTGYVDDAPVAAVGSAGSLQMRTNKGRVAFLGLTLDRVGLEYSLLFTVDMVTGTGETYTIKHEPVSVSRSTFTHLEWGAQILHRPSTPQIRSQRLCIRE